MIPAKENQGFTEFIPNLIHEMPGINELHPEEAARWLFLDRFISIDKLSKMLGVNPEAFHNDSIQKDLKIFMDRIFSTPRVSKLIRKGAIAKLQMLFSSSVLLFRNSYLADNNEAHQPCNIANLRDRFPAYFYAPRESPNWYEKEPFYTEDICIPRWVLVELNFLNCILINSQQAKYLYSKRKTFPLNSVKQKSVIEEIYDRITIQEILGEELLDSNCNVLTSTRYRKNSKTIFHVYIVQKESKIGFQRSHKKPTFRKKRPYWPGFFPSVEF